MLLQKTARRSTSKIKQWYITNVRRDAMVVVDLGYRKVILSKEQAFVLIECLEKAETYEEKYWNEAKRKEFGMENEYTYHVYPNEKSFSMQVISNDIYRMAKLAGKPEEKKDN